MVDMVQALQLTAASYLPTEKCLTQTSNIPPMALSLANRNPAFQP